MRLLSNTSVLLSLLLFGTSVSATTQLSVPNPDAFLTWTAQQADKIGKSTRENGKAGGSFDTRIISTNKAINYGLRATLMTPEVIRATARIAQLRERLTDDQTRKIVSDAEDAGDLVVMVEINPNEGSGVIPLDWRIFIQPKGLPPGSKGAIPGIKSPYLRNMPGLSGVYGRNYDYDVFWIVFPLVNEKKEPLLSPELAELQMIIGIYNSEGRISWKMPDSLRQKIRELSKP